MPLQIDDFEDYKQVTEFCRNRFYRERHRDGFATVTVMAGDYFFEHEFALIHPDEREFYNDLIHGCGETAVAVVGNRAKELVFA